MMEIQIVACVAENNVIGYNGEMPWGVLNADMARFKELTLYGIVIMGMNTYRSIGKPLKNRINIIITSDSSLCERDVILDEARGTLEIFVSSFADALKCASASIKFNSITGIFVIGGQIVYEQAMPYASRMHLTELFEEHLGDRFFPEFDATEWKMVNEEYASEKGREMRFVEYMRRNF